MYVLGEEGNSVYIGVNISSFLPLQNRMCHSSIFGPYNVHNPGLIFTNMSKFCPIYICI